jgi:hypothetical protein
VIEQAKLDNKTPDLSGFNVPLLREATSFTQIGDWSLLAPEGPLWFRGYANWPEDAATNDKVAAFLDKAGLDRIVVGHTPTSDARIAPRFGARAIVIDTGMLTAAYKGRPAALEILGGRLNAIYEDGAVPLSEPSELLMASLR